MTDSQSPQPAPPAFPLADSCCEYGGTNRSEANGMSLRDYFAAKAMHGWMTTFIAVLIDDGDYETVATNAYRMADAMLKARGGAK